MYVVDNFTLLQKFLFIYWPPHDPNVLHATNQWVVSVLLSAMRMPNAIRVQSASVISLFYCCWLLLLKCIRIGRDGPDTSYADGQFLATLPIGSGAKLMNVNIYRTYYYFYRTVVCVCLSVGPLGLKRLWNGSTKNQ